VSQFPVWWSINASIFAQGTRLEKIAAVVWAAVAPDLLLAEKWVSYTKIV